MKIEPLIGKRISPQHVETADGGTGYEFYSNEHGQLFEYDEVKAAVLFYKTYHSNRNLLYKNDKEAFDEWMNSDYHMKCACNLDGYDESAMNAIFNAWLLSYAFRDVI